MDRKEKDPIDNAAISKKIVATPKPKVLSTVHMCQYWMFALNIEQRQKGAYVKERMRPMS